MHFTIEKYSPVLGKPQWMSLSIDIHHDRHNFCHFGAGDSDTSAKSRTDSGLPWLWMSSWACWGGRSFTVGTVAPGRDCVELKPASSQRYNWSRNFCHHSTKFALSHYLDLARVYVYTLEVKKRKKTVAENSSCSYFELPLRLMHKCESWFCPNDLQSLLSILWETPSVDTVVNMWCLELLHPSCGCEWNIVDT